ncbi:hypothetical protein [Aminobacter ciceronei]|uniref:Uncharacterized protein n=1 Tax=Aminobacter ciceronei TaxID=150723 RepID=A0ABR6C507_9HYPH|nr:hypothetical protein [Aminobacter ciceronei]MBA8906057.1 hypothetical protein [Aminobacter ciceronei]MBA9019836.1 hypothetical protein [Aminobacter ciceronei]
MKKLAVMRGHMPFGQRSQPQSAIVGGVCHSPVSEQRDFSNDGTASPVRHFQDTGFDFENCGLTLGPSVNVKALLIPADHSSEAISPGSSYVALC